MEIISRLEGVRKELISKKCDDSYDNDSDNEAVLVISFVRKDE